MKKILLVTMIATGANAFAQNSCMEALPLELGLHTVDTVDGVYPEVLCFGGNTQGDNAEWYTFTAEEAMLLTITTDLEQNLGRDTRLSVYSGECGSLTCLASDDDSGVGYLTVLDLFLEPGQTIILAWDDRWEPDGFDFELVLSEVPDLAFIPTPVTGGGNRLGLVDMNGDFLDDIVSVNGDGEIFINYQLAEGGTEYVAIGNEPTAFYPSWSMAAGDLDGNGYNDLVFGGGSGVTFMFANEDGTAYNETSGTEYVFSQRSNCVDINNDGKLDAFVCHDVQPNVYYISDGEGGLVYFQGGLGETENGGNYGSIWVDYDNDGDNDLFIAKCRGGESQAKYNQMHRNNGDGTYTEVSQELDLYDPVQTWSSAWGDYDNDGDLDCFIGASSFSDGNHKMLRNDGEGVFVDITEETGLGDVPGSGIENITHDFDNDGYLDIFGMGGTFMKNNGDWTFTEVDVAPGNGPVGDINNDGFLDILNGSVFINVPNDNNWIKINTIGTESNINGIGAMIHVYTPNGMLTRHVRSGDGFRYMSSITAHFGLGQEEEIEMVEIIWPSGTVDVLTDVEINSTLNVVEGSFVVSVDEAQIGDLKVYPNPATDVLFFELPAEMKDARYSIFDLHSRLVARGVANKNSINVSDIARGAYLLRLDAKGTSLTQKIILE